MNLRKTSSKAKNRTKRSNSKMYKVSTGNSKLLASPNLGSSVRGGSRRVLRTLSKMSKGMNVGGSNTTHLIDDKRCVELFEQFSSHVKGYPLASLKTPPSIYFDTLQSKLLDLEQVRGKTLVSMKKRRKSPKKAFLSLKNSTLTFSDPKSSPTPAKSPMLSMKNLPTGSGASVKRLGKLKIFEMFSSRQQANHSSDISLSLFYDILYNPTRPHQFRIRFYRDVTQERKKANDFQSVTQETVENETTEGKDEQLPNQTQFYSISIRFQDKETCDKWIMKILKSIQNLIMFIKSLIEEVTELDELAKKGKEDKEKVAVYARCLLDLSFWLYGYESEESVKMIDLYLKFLEKSKDLDFEEELNNWKEAREEILLILKKSVAGEKSKGILSLGSRGTTTEEGGEVDYIAEMKQKLLL